MKKVLPYTITNRLEVFLRSEQAARLMVEKNKKVLLSDIEKDLAKYCGISRNGILRIKRNLSIASLPIAFKIAEYFDVSVYDIFELENKEKILMNNDIYELEDNQEMEMK